MMTEEEAVVVEDMIEEEDETFMARVEEVVMGVVGTVGVMVE